VIFGTEDPGTDADDRVASTEGTGEWLARLAETRSRTLDTIDSLGPDAFSRIGTHRRFGPMSVLQCLEEIAAGDHQHLLRLQGRSPAGRSAPAHAALPSITHERRVLLHHVNMGGVVTTLSMLVYLEEAEAALLRSLGLSEFERRFIRIYFEIQHRRPCYYDDVLTVHLMVSRVGDRSTHYDFTIFNRGAVAAFGRWGLGFRDEAGGLARIPEHVRTVLERPDGPDGTPETPRQIVELAR
jgi:acyl-CoA thioesterase FadM